MHTAFSPSQLFTHTVYFFLKQFTPISSFWDCLGCILKVWGGESAAKIYVSLQITAFLPCKWDCRSKLRWHLRQSFRSWTIVSHIFYMIVPDSKYLLIHSFGLLLCFASSCPSFCLHCIWSNTCDTNVRVSTCLKGTRCHEKRKDKLYLVW